MGMTIDDAINAMEYHGYYSESTEECARKTAINTMRKYQEIENIVEDWNYKPPLAVLHEIVMVVEERAYYKKKLDLIPMED